ncbi:MAG: 3-hydroxyacyl-CoA dehydrogenase NAD-binding domain-containing protein, partial [Actinobacteria bacterium]|nr:3-hydroxyacyl-CoA dehydrogenase NAD-binding domain-containing protein [Actinomycetota bacterium]
MEIRSIGIVGAGTMGRGIAELVAMKGYEAILVDRSDELADAARKAIDLSLSRQLEKWAITEAEKKVALDRIQVTSDITRLADADIAIESVIEDLDTKKEIFRVMDQVCQKNIILASNTSTLSITEMGAVTYRPRRIIGLHFLNPVTKMKVVEIVRGLKTSDETFQESKEFVQDLDKTGVEVYESPGFVTTRLIMPLINEAMYALMEGVASAEGIDTAMKLGYDFAKGPLEMADRMGLDSVLTAMERLWRDFG